MSDDLIGLVISGEVRIDDLSEAELVHLLDGLVDRISAAVSERRTPADGPNAPRASDTELGQLLAAHSHATSVRAIKELQAFLRVEGLSRPQAAARLRTTEARIDDLVAGRTDRLPWDVLVDMLLASAGLL